MSMRHDAGYAAAEVASFVRRLAAETSLREWAYVRPYTSSEQRRAAIDPWIDSYSGFFDNGWRRSTGLAEYLKERNVDERTLLK